MKAEFWHDRWHKSEIAFHQQEINTRLQKYWIRLNRPKNSRVFVPLCGKSLDMLWLRTQGHRVLGVEISAVAVQDFFAENDLTPEITGKNHFELWETDGLVILVGDFFALTRGDLEGVVGVYDRASLIALPPPMRKDYVRHLEKIIPTDAETLLVTLEYPQQEMDGPPFSVKEAEVRELYEGGFVITQLFSADVLDKIPRFQEKGLSYLLEEVYHLVPRRQVTPKPN